MIDPEKFYTVKETAQILKLSVDTVRYKCRTWKLEASNISETPRAQFRIKGENILLFLNK